MPKKQMQISQEDAVSRVKHRDLKAQSLKSTIKINNSSSKNGSVAFMKPTTLP